MGLGRGNFGLVRLAYIKGEEGKDVLEGHYAVKSLKNEGVKHKKDLIKEIEAMDGLEHNNVVKLYGACLDPLMVIIEFAEGGVLKSALQERVRLPKEEELLPYALDIARGGEYIAGKGIVHKDIALRNMLVIKKGEKVIVKIGDFGLAEKVEGEYVKVRGPLPIKWTAPEALKKDGCFYKKSDVWSYGVVLYEMTKGGKKEPYMDRGEGEIIKGIDENPGTVSDDYKEIKKVVRECWMRDLKKRGTFDKIVEYLKGKMSKIRAEATIGYTETQDACSDPQSSRVALITNRNNLDSVDD